MKIFRPVYAAPLSTLVVAGIFLSACSSSHDNENVEDDVVFVQGLALSVLDGAARGARDFVVSDLTNANTIVAVGQSDAEGRYAFELSGIEGPVLIAFLRMDTPAEPRSSGLVELTGLNVTKTLDGVSDLAAVAGFAAVREGEISIQDLTTERIENLELGARDVINVGGVDFTNFGSVEAAAERVLEITASGAHPPAAP